MRQRVHRHEVVQPQDQSYRLIPLTQGVNAIVDADDYEWLNSWDWFAAWNAHTKSFYAVRNFTVSKNKRIILRMHRVILGCEAPDEQGDHRNGNTLDNRRKNLRKCTQPQNARNSPARINNKSGYKGVSFRKSHGKWVAQINDPVKSSRYIGYFDSPEEAALAYDEAAKRLHGEFAVLNFPLGIKTGDTASTT